MQEFENVGLFNLRDILIETMEPVVGRDFMYGWLKAAYKSGHYDFDNSRDDIITEIIKYRNLSKEVKNV